MKRFIAILLLLTGCVSNDIPRPPVLEACETNPLQLVIEEVRHVSGCYNNGEILISANDVAKFSIDGTTFEDVTAFVELAAGDYTIYALTEQGCRDSVSVRVNAYASDLSSGFSAGADTQCQGSDGSITVEPVSGMAPYKFSLNNSGFTTDNYFPNLESGTYQIKVVDVASCEYTFEAVVPRASTGVSWSGEVKTIFETRCAKSGCHDNNSGRISLTNWENIHAYKNIIYNKVSSGAMPFDGPLEPEQKAKILCWILDGGLEN